MIKAAARSVTPWLARRWPTGLYGSLGLLARATAPLARRGETARRVRAVFPHLPEPAADRTITEVRGAELKSRALGIVLANSRSEPVFPPVAVDGAFAAIRGPAILATVHVGAFGGLGAALRRVPGEILALHRMEWALPSNVAGVYVARTEVAGARAFYRSVMTIRRGGCVLIVADDPGHAVAVLGRDMMLARGPFALARVTGAPVIPVFARWDGASIDVVCGATIRAAQDEATMAQAMAAALERHLLERPAAIGTRLLRDLTRG